MDPTQPSATRMCHRTGFTKKCRVLTSSGKCERWKILPVEEDGRQYHKGDCIDDWVFYFGFANERGLAQLTKSTDKVANHAEQGHTESMAVIMRHMLSAPEPDERFQRTINVIEGGKDHD